MGKKLEKTEYLLSIEKVLKKYGYTRMYCSGRFTGVREPGLMFTVDGDPNDEAIEELTAIVDPVYGMDDYDINNASGVGCIKGISDMEWMRNFSPVYEEGEFYANEG